MRMLIRLSASLRAQGAKVRAHGAKVRPVRCRQNYGTLLRAWPCHSAGGRERMLTAETVRDQIARLRIARSYGAKVRPAHCARPARCRNKNPLLRASGRLASLP